MDRLKRLRETFNTLVAEDFSGYIRINFSQGSLGRVEKFEEFYDASIFPESEEPEAAQEARMQEGCPAGLKKTSSRIFGMTGITGMVLAASFALLSGCSTTRTMPGDGSTAAVAPGDVADIRFLCRLGNGEVVALTDKAMEQQRDMPKSTVFLPRTGDAAIPVEAVGASSSKMYGRETPFEVEIVNRLAREIIGMKAGESRMVTLTASDVPERDEENYLIRVARIRVRDKEMIIKPAEYSSREGRPAEIGQPYILDPLVPGKVEKVTDDEVVVSFSAKPGDVVTTPFGPGHIGETEKHYEIVIDARRGALIRTGPLVGRIVDVSDKFITIDYRNPFGGETLTCDLSVEKIVGKKQLTGKAE